MSLQVASEKNDSVFWERKTTVAIAKCFSERNPRGLAFWGRKKAQRWRQESYVRSQARLIIYIRWMWKKQKILEKQQVFGYIEKHCVFFLFFWGTLVWAVAIWRKQRAVGQPLLYPGEHFVRNSVKIPKVWTHSRISTNLSRIYGLGWFGLLGVYEKVAWNEAQCDGHTCFLFFSWFSTSWRKDWKASRMGSFSIALEFRYIAELPSCNHVSPHSFHTSFASEGCSPWLLDATIISLEC